MSSFPGIQLRGLHRLLGISMGTLRYHSGKMENEKEIFCEEKRGRKLFFKTVPDGSIVKVTGMMHSCSNRKILVVLLEKGSPANGEVSSLTKLSYSAVSEALK